MPNSNFDDFLSSLNLTDKYCICYYCGKSTPITTTIDNKFHPCPNCKKEIFIKSLPIIKKDWYKFYVYLKHIKPYNNIKLYHFTDRSNLENITKYGGLFSWVYLEKNNILVHKPGGNQLSRDLDLRKNLQDYVRLSFNQNIPMYHKSLSEGRIKDPIWIEFDPIVILFEGVKFSNINATDNSAFIGESINDFLRINFNIATVSDFNYSNDLEKKQYQAEVLIKDFLPIFCAKLKGK